MNRGPHNLLSSPHHPGPGRNRGGFTLLELLLAVAIFSIVLVAINTVFFASMRLRRSVTESLDASVPLNHALALMRKDLQNAIGPAGTLAGHFRSGAPVGVAVGQSSGSGSSASSAGRSTLPTATGGGFDASGLSFFTTTGLIRDDAPYGEIQEVNYQLVTPEDGTDTGRELVRSVTRNLLTYTTPASEMQRLVRNVDQLEFEYYDGTQWRNEWDTTIGDVGLPVAVRVRIQLVPEKQVSIRQEPIQMMVLLSSNIGTNTVATVDESQLQ